MSTNWLADAIAKEAAEWASAYAAVFAPYVTYLMSDDKAYKNNKTFPASITEAYI
jgi:hypothetical protein